MLSLINILEHALSCNYIHLFATTLWTYFFTYELTGHYFLAYLRSNLLLSEVRDTFVSVFIIARFLLVHHLVFLRNNNAFKKWCLYLFRIERVPSDVLQNF